MKNLLKRIISFFSSKPVFIGNSLTGSEERLEKDPTAKVPNNLIFYKLRKDLGAFEIVRVKQKSSGAVSYVVYSCYDNVEFEISKKWFEFLFEEDLQKFPEIKSLLSEK